MCDLNGVDLIDLSLEDDNLCSNKQIKSKCSVQSFEDKPLLPPICHERKSLGNNPFDSIQKLVDRVDDPFDIVEKEASLKAFHYPKLPSEVKIGNLLSLSADNLFDDEQKVVTPSLITSELSTVQKEIDLESPPVVFHEKLALDSISGTDTDSNQNSSTETSASAKLKKHLEYRKRLLKLSISNAAHNSPTTRKQSLGFEEIFGTPVSSKMSKAAECGENLLAAESPLKLVEDDGLMSEEASNLIDSEKNFEADLEMLKIPILNELASPAVTQTSINTTESYVEVENKTSASFENTLTNIETIKAKLRAKKDEFDNNNQQKIYLLIQDLKTLISSGEMEDKIKKQRASDLLESLSVALKQINTKDETPKNCSEMIQVIPQTIKRQDTFDMDLQEKHETNLDNQPLVKEMSTSMVSSSATYDGETLGENQDLNLPEIAPSFQNSTAQCRNRYNKTMGINNGSENCFQNDINDIMEQLGKLLVNNTADNRQRNKNPTFIVVMDANQFNYSNLSSCNQNDVDAKERAAFVANYLENSLNDGSPGLTKVNSIQRRRSQSLSIHDKMKIVKLPLQQPTPFSIREQHSVQLDVSPPITTTPPSGDKQKPEIKTPMRIMRRNSYSSGTPLTPQLCVRRTGFGSERRTKTLDTYHENQQQAIARSISMPSKNLSTFKPDLKKKPKHNTESIIKSSGPLKAFKKVGLMLKMSPPTPEKNMNTSLIHNISFYDQSKLSKLPTTPLQAKRSSTLDVGVDRPKACSTPAAFTSPLQRTTGPIIKQRYSYMSATPCPKSSVTNSVSSARLRRRTITEFKTKYPLKPRGSGSTGLEAASSCRASTSTTRLSTSAGPRISKTPVKTTTANTETVKPTSCLRSRISLSGSALSARNKENKRP